MGTAIRTVVLKSCNSGVQSGKPKMNQLIMKLWCILIRGLETHEDYPPFPIEFPLLFDVLCCNSLLNDSIDIAIDQHACSPHSKSSV